VYECEHSGKFQEYKLIKEIIMCKTMEGGPKSLAGLSKNLVKPEKEKRR
jgi:hypothetical protein